MEIKFKKCDINDIDTLRELSIKTFKDSFEKFNTAENMSKYINIAFDKSKLLSELSNKDSEFIFIYVDNELSGYIKLNTNGAQTEFKDTNSLEIERIYVKKEFQNMGIGTALMKKAIDIAKELQKSIIWLGVWEKNYSAISFYKRHGFTETGSHKFFLGDDEQKDLIMKKNLA